MCLLCTEIQKGKMTRVEIGKACFELLDNKKDEHIEEILRNILFEIETDKEYEELVEWIMRIR